MTPRVFGRSVGRKLGSSGIRREPPNTQTAERSNVIGVATSPLTRHKAGWVILVGTLLLLVISLGWYLTRRHGLDLGRVANLDASGETVVFFGDSITRGYGVRPEESISSVMARALGFVFVNAGIPGDTMAAGLGRIDRDVIAHHPRLTLVEFGGNNFLCRVPRPLLQETDRRRAFAVRQSQDFPLPALRALAKLDTQ